MAAMADSQPDMGIVNQTLDEYYDYLAKKKVEKGKYQLPQKAAVTAETDVGAWFDHLTRQMMMNYDKRVNTEMVEPVLSKEDLRAAEVLAEEVATTEMEVDEQFSPEEKRDAQEAATRMDDISRIPLREQNTQPTHPRVIVSPEHAAEMEKQNHMEDAHAFTAEEVQEFQKREAEREQDKDSAETPVEVKKEEDAAETPAAGEMNVDSAETGEQEEEDSAETPIPTGEMDVDSAEVKKEEGPAETGEMDVDSNETTPAPQTALALPAPASQTASQTAAEDVNMSNPPLALPAPQTRLALPAPASEPAAILGQFGYEEAKHEEFDYEGKHELGSNIPGESEETKEVLEHIPDNPEIKAALVDAKVEEAIEDKESKAWKWKAFKMADHFYDQDKLNALGSPDGFEIQSMVAEARLQVEEQLEEENKQRELEKLQTREAVADGDISKRKKFEDAISKVKEAEWQGTRLRKQVSRAVKRRAVHGGLLNDIVLSTLSMKDEAMSGAPEIPDMPTVVELEQPEEIEEIEDQGNLSVSDLVRALDDRRNKGDKLWKAVDDLLDRTKVKKGVRSKPTLAVDPQFRLEIGGLQSAPVFQAENSKQASSKSHGKGKGRGLKGVNKRGKRNKAKK